MKRLFLLAALPAVVVFAPEHAHSQNYNFQPAMAMPKSMQHKVAVDGGITLASGNTDAKNMNVNAKLTTNYDRFENTLKGRAINFSQNDQRSGENYLVNDKLKYNISPELYGFGEAEYYNNRYAGFEGRMHEMAGLGYYFRNDEKVKVSAETGAGARQIKYTGTALSDQNEFGAKAGGNINYKFNDNVSFNQDADYYWSDSLQTTRAESAFKAYMDKNLYMKATYLIENNSDVPLGRKDNDQLTMFGVGYELGGE